MSWSNLTSRVALAAGLVLIVGIAASGGLLWQLHTASAGYDRVLGLAEQQYRDDAREKQAAFAGRVEKLKELLASPKNEDPSFNKAERAARDQARRLLAGQADPRARKQVQGILSAHDAMRRSHDAGLRASESMRGQQRASADALLAGVGAMPAAADTVGATARSARQAEISSRTRAWLVALIAMVAAVTTLTVLILRGPVTALRGMAASLTHGSRRMLAGAGQVTAASQALSQGATQQAASLEETSAALEEIASITKQNADNSRAAAALMAEVDAKVQGSNQALSDMVTSMASIQESSQRVAKIIKTIDEIAFQTNILALNAAVEAARAGEAGMGFAVVADEVRNLAQRSAQAARDTAALIEESIGKAQSGNVKVEQVATAIAGITDSVSRVKGLVDEVSGASRQQSQGIAQVSHAISQMEQVTQTTAATAGQSAVASEELTAQAAASLQVVDRLELLVGAPSVTVDRARVTAPKARVKGARVLSMPAGAKAPKRRTTSEPQLPMGSTGTFGKF
jgi:methyl-accepting chemotaxis protein